MNFEKWIGEQVFKIHNYNLQFCPIPASVCIVIFCCVTYTFSIFLSSYYNDTQFGDISHALFEIW